ncbi:MAG: ABC transporter permease [Dehalococcoidales bacterium]|nr:ABC transporter permease [Dehalococcoidales bacterium]
MENLWQGLIKALQLIISLDPEVIQIAGRSLWIAATSCILATIVCLPLGSIIHFNKFYGKRLLINILQTLYSVPTVAVGLFVFVFISRAGPLGSLGIMFTPIAVIIGQVILITPVITGLTVSALSGVDKGIAETAVSLGANRLQKMILVLREARYAIISAVIMGFSRAVSEVGLSLMIGGNIKGFTRTITTAISLETSKGNLELSLALGMILIFLALLVNIAFNQLQHR